MSSSGTYNYALSNADVMIEAASFRNGVIKAADTLNRLVPTPARRFTVYAAVNSVNGHAYVGVTSRPLNCRKREHFCDARNGSKRAFHRAIQKHGPDKFTFYVVSKLPTLATALSEEVHNIETLRPEYNMTLGGDGGSGHTVSLLHRQKLAALRRAERGNKKLSRHALDACLENAKKANAARSKAVICETDGAIYPTVAAAAKAYGLRVGQVSQYCLRRHKSRRGLVFQYLGSA